MKKLLLALGIMALMCSPAMAGRNANGAMLLHVNNALNYSALQPYCDNTLYPIPQDCNGLVTNVTKSPDVEAMIWMVGAFELGASPAVNAYQVGLGGDVTNAFFTDWAPCGTGFFEIPDAGWPGAGTGTAVAYPAPITDHLFKMYWFAAGAPGAGSTLSTVDYYAGDHHAEWVDNSSPPIVDFCSLFGSVVWGGQGALNCPNPPRTGACCFADGTCQDVLQDVCGSLGGTFEGAGTNCATFPCPQPHFACCFADGSCQDLTEADCAQQGGVFHGGVLCASNPCPPPIGACCFNNGATCTDLIETDCAAQGGIFHSGVTCETPGFTCPVIPTGACCVNGACTITTQADCTGQYLGDGTTCDNNPCAVPTKPSTWGQIKGSYR